MIKPANPEGETNPLINITKAPKPTPKDIPTTALAKKETKVVNSTFGGRGVNWIPVHKAARTAKSAR
ncbi:MAG: hypothetical protein ABSG57_11780 [Candidatus Bathyarchaeia archaeon]